MSNSRFYAISVMLLFTLVLSADETRNGQISSVSTTKTKATIEGVGGHDWEVVLRIGADTAASPFDSVSWWKDQRSFTSTIEYGKIVPLGDKQFGEGIVWKLEDKNGSGSTTNIGFSQDHPVLSGTVRFRSEEENKRGMLAIEADGSKVIIADVVHNDGSTEPVTIFLRPR